MGYNFLNISFKELCCRYLNFSNDIEEIIIIFLKYKGNNFRYLEFFKILYDNFKNRIKGEICNIIINKI